MNGIKGKNHRIGTYKINKILFSCVDGRVYMVDQLLVTRINLNKKAVVLRTTKKAFL